MKLGKTVVGFGKIPAGSDASTLWHLFQAGEKPVMMTSGTWWGGDSGENMALYLAPPGPSIANGTQSPADYGGDERNAIAAVAGTLAGGEYTNVKKGSIFTNYLRGSMILYVPANWTVLIHQEAANTNTWKVSLQGFEIEG